MLNNVNVVKFPDDEMTPLLFSFKIFSQSSRVTFELPQTATSHDKKETSTLLSPSPWEREEKEKVSIKYQLVQQRASLTPRFYHLSFHYC